MNKDFPVFKYHKYYCSEYSDSWENYMNDKFLVVEVLFKLYIYFKFW